MKLTLIERQESRLRCVPDLGIANLLGQCREKGVKAKLVQGSPNTLKCLLDDAAFPLFCRGYADIVKERGESWFKEFLEYNYSIATSNNIYDKTNPDALRDLWELATYMRERVWHAWLPGFLFKEIEKTKPDAVGFSVWDFYGNPTVAFALNKTIAFLRRELDVPILIGGPGTVTKTARIDLMKLFSPDFIVHHEGELALFDALGMAESGKVEDKQNITSRKYDGESRPIEDLDSLALPDFSQYDLDEFFLPVRVLPVMTSRGCEWARCAFCNHHATYKGYREYGLERVAEMVEDCKTKYKTDMIMLHDETLTARRARVLVEHLPEAYYYSYAYPKGFDSGLLKKMQSKGFRVIVWGLESGCQKVLNSMRKGTDIKEVGQILKDSYNAGITNVGFVMFGFPGETKKQAMETIEFLRRNSQYIERHGASQFRVAEGSPIWEQPGLWGVELEEGGHRVKRGLQPEGVKKFLAEMNKKGLRTSASTKYAMPGDSEFRAYFFMQVVYGEGLGEYPVRNGILAGNEVWPSLLMKNVTRPKLQLDKEHKKTYQKCDGRHKVDATGFEQYPYVVHYSKRF